MDRRLAYRLVAFALSLNYFCFQVEAFEEEYRANHHAPSERASVVLPGLTWETFDKENAQQPFLPDGEVQLQIILRIPLARPILCDGHVPSDLIRDKSPPPASV